MQGEAGCQGPRSVELDGVLDELRRAEMDSHPASRAIRFRSAEVLDADVADQRERKFLRFPRRLALLAFEPVTVLPEAHAEGVQSRKRQMALRALHLVLAREQRERMTRLWCEQRQRHDQRGDEEEETNQAHAHTSLVGLRLRDHRSFEPVT